MKTKQHFHSDISSISVFGQVSEAREGRRGRQIRLTLVCVLRRALSRHVVL